jgi:hypothetical protein
LVWCYGNQKIQFLPKRNTTRDHHKAQLVGLMLSWQPEICSYLKENTMHHHYRDQVLSLSWWLPEHSVLTSKKTQCITIKKISRWSYIFMVTKKFSSYLKENTMLNHYGHQFVDPLPYKFWRRVWGGYLLQWGILLYLYWEGCMRIMHVQHGIWIPTQHLLEEPGKPWKSQLSWMAAGLFRYTLALMAGLMLSWQPENSVPTSKRKQCVTITNISNG